MDIMAQESIRVGLAGTVVQATLERCYDAVVPAGGNAVDHLDACWCVWVMRQGSVQLIHAGGRLVANAGDLVLVPAGLRRTQRFTPGAHLLSLRLVVGREDGRRPFASCPPRRLPGEGPLARDMAALSATTDGDSPMRRAALFAAAVAAWWECCLASGWSLPASEARDARVEAALAVLRGHGRIAPAPWPALSAATGLSRRQTDRLFQSHLGCSPGDWLDQRTVERAATLLADPYLPVKMVARRCGFRDDSHFVRWYRRHTGRTPGLRSGHA